MPSKISAQVNVSKVLAGKMSRLGAVASAGKPRFMDVIANDFANQAEHRTNAGKATAVTDARLTADAVLADRPRQKSRAATLANPKLAAHLARLRPHLVEELASQERGYTRDEAALPVSESPDPSDTTLFEAPDDPDRKLYLPRYRLREQDGRYDIAVRASGERGWRLTIGLERFPAPELRGAIKGASVIDHQLAVFVRYGSGPSGSIQKRVDFGEIVRHDDSGPTVSVELTLAERDSLLHALQTPESGTQLVVRRAVEVAVRKQKAPTQQAKAEVLMQGAMADMTKAASSRGGQLAARPLAREMAGRLKHAKVRAATTMAEAAAEERLQEAERAGVEAEKRRQEAKRGREEKGEQSAPRYESQDLALDDIAEPDPFVLDPRLHGYFYEPLGGAQSGSEAGFRRVVLAHPEGEADQRFHAYLQDQGEPWVFYYLPDQFRLARRDESPFFPQMVVRINAADGDIENANVTVDYVMEPSVSADRLVTAENSLVQEIPGSLRGEHAVQLRPLQAQARLKLWLPGTGGSDLHDMADVEIDLANGFVHSLTLPIDGFQEAFAAGHSRDATTLFTGRVLVETGLSAPEQIPATIRFADTEGDVLDLVQTTEGNTIGLRVTNAIESPVRVTTLPVRLQRADSDVEGRIVEGLVELPFELASGDELTLRIEPAADLPGEGPVDVILDTRGVEILPDPDSILPAISDTSVPAHYLRGVEVRTMPELLGEEGAPDSVLLVNVEFKGGSSARVTRDEPNMHAQVRLPFTDVLLGRDVEGRYAFKQQIVRRDGSRTEDSDWREAEFSLLVVPIA